MGIAGVVVLIALPVLVLMVIVCAWGVVLRGPDHYVNDVRHKGLIWECDKCKAVSGDG